MNALQLKFILVGRSGSGKTTMADILEAEFGLRRCITSTTRPPRPDEVDGKDYYFCSDLDPAQLFESACFGGNRYGVTWSELKRSDFVILDPQGAAYYREHFPNPLVTILLERENIQVDPDRMARDAAAGFDKVAPDAVVRGDSVPEMASCLIAALKACGIISHPPLDRQIFAAGERTANNNAPSPYRSCTEPCL